MLDTQRVQDTGEADGIVHRAMVEGAGGFDQTCTVLPFEFVPQRLGTDNEPCVELARVGVAKDPRGAVRTAVRVGWCRPLQQGHVLPALGETPRGGGAGESCAYDDVLAHLAPSLPLERGDPSDLAAHDQGLDEIGALVGVDDFHVREMAGDVVLEQQAVAAEQVAGIAA